MPTRAAYLLLAYSLKKYLVFLGCPTLLSYAYGAVGQGRNLNKRVIIRRIATINSEKAASFTIGAAYY
jgi:hypothetical protein